MTLAEKILSGSMIAIVIYLIVTNGSSTASVINAGSGAFTGGVKALQGR